MLQFGEMSIYFGLLLMTFLFVAPLLLSCVLSSPSVMNCKYMHIIDLDVAINSGHLSRVDCESIIKYDNHMFVLLIITILLKQSTYFYSYTRLHSCLSLDGSTSIGNEPYHMLLRCCIPSSIPIVEFCVDTATSR